MSSRCRTASNCGRLILLVAAAALATVAAAAQAKAAVDEIGTLPPSAPAPAATCGDCREGDFRTPLIYFYWRNTSAQRCCDLCSTNETCAYAIHDGTIGNCFPSPASSTGFKTQGGIQTCRTARAPPWPAPTPPPLALSVWPQVSLHGNATGGTALAGASPALAIKCSSGGCPNPVQLAWYQQRLRADAPDELCSGSQHPTVAPTGGLVATISVSVTEGAHTVMLPDTDESYSLACEKGAGDAGGGSCTVRSTSTTGALRGLETLAHLAQAQAIPVPLKLHDSPRFPYRKCLSWCVVVWLCVCNHGVCRFCCCARPPRGGAFTPTDIPHCCIVAQVAL
jgi:hypothetical protein